MQLISNRLQEIRSSIRQQQLASLMQKRRLEAQRSEQEEVLKEISEMPQHQLTLNHLGVLVSLANKDISNALIMLGNLVIDRVVLPEHFEGVEWMIGSSEYWPWLVHSLAEVGFCTREMFQLCITRIIAKTSAFSLEQALEVFLLSLKMGSQAVQSAMTSPQLVIALANHVLENGERIPQLALTILSSLTSQESDLPQIMAGWLGEARLEAALLQALMKVQSRPRILACQIANNLIMSGIYLQRVHLRLLEQALSEKEGVKIEISFYLKAFSEIAHQNLILRSAKHHRLLEVLNAYSLLPNSPKNGHLIAENSRQAASVIRQRFQNSTQSSNPERENGRSLQQLQKIMDESQEPTIYQDESARMIE